MALLIGQPIDARELEQATSGWSPDRFAAMCDALAWAVSGQACSCLPSFTNRVNAKDGGIDAEWSVDLPENDRSVPTPILGPGWNVFQYKKRDLLAQDRKRIIATLKSLLKGEKNEGAINEVVSRHQRHPDRYVLFVNVDLLSKDKTEIKESILKDYSKKSKIHVEIIGAAELAAFLNNHTHLRASYFTPLSFKTWEEANKFHHVQKLFGANVELIGRDNELKKLKAYVNDQKIRVIVLTGPHDMGKSRLALEATQHRIHDVVVALDPKSMDLSEYRALVSAKKEVICIIEDPEPKDLRSLVGEVLTLPSLKVIITLPLRDSKSSPTYGLDNRVKPYPIEQLTAESARKLLNTAAPSLDFEVEGWIISHAGGNPGILLAAASLGSNLRRDVPSFTDAVGQEFERRIKEDFSEDAFKCASLISLLTHVGIAGAFESELTLICKLFGDGWTPHEVLIRLEELEKAGILKRGGSFTEITLPLLANYLVSKMLRGRLNELLVLFAKLPEEGLHRFIRRLSEVKGKETGEFWDEMFSPNGLMGNFDRAMSHPHLLRLIAGPVPDRVLRVIETGVRHATLETRLAIEGDPRHELIWALEELLYRKKTSAGALRIIWLLAEAKNETLFDNPPQLLKECFHFHNPQMPLSLFERIGLLKEFTSSDVSKQGKLLAIECIEDALRPHATFLMFTSIGPEPLDSMYRCTFEELCHYGEELIGILLNLEKIDAEVANVALRVLPHLTADLGTQISPQLALKHLETLVNWACSRKLGLDVSAIFSAINSLHREFSGDVDIPEFPQSRKTEFQQYVAELDRLKEELESAEFSVRLKRWAGSWGYDLEIDEPQSDGRLKYEHELEKLAAEAVVNRQFLDSVLFEWLGSPSAQRAYSFFSSLGELDECQIFLGLIEESGKNPSGVGVFSSYWGGWAKKDPKAAEARLDQLTDQNAVSGEAIILATSTFTASAAAVNRVQKQIQAGRVEPKYVAGALQIRRWLEGLTADEFLELLKAIAGPSFEYAGSVVRMFG
ncbi:MAG: ATP-binding protein, partial [Nitrospirota bacterium]|nr:ATP-binding protein [Nitrospirota bacterium]